MGNIGSHATALAARRALGRAVAESAPGALSQQRLTELLCGLTDTESAETQRWVKMLLDVAAAGIISDVLDADRRPGAQERICAETALSFDSARWAVEAWCEALGVEAPPPASFETPAPLRPRRRPPVTEPDSPAPAAPSMAQDGEHAVGRADWTVAACSADGSLVAGAGPDHAVWLHRLGVADAPRLLTRHDGRVVALAFSPDGQTLASGSRDGTVCLSPVTGPSAEDGAPVGVLTAHAAGVSALAFSPHGNLLATASEGGAITLWDPHLGTPVRKIKGHDAAVSAIAFRSGGRVLISGGEDDTVRMWLSASGTAGHVLPLRGPVAALGLDPTGLRLAVSRRLGFSVRRFNWPANVSPITATLGAMLRGDVFFLTGAPWAHDCAGVRTFAFDPSGDLLAGGAADGTVAVWGADRGTPLGRAGGHAGPVLAARFTGDGMRLVSVGADGFVRRWRWRP